MVMKLENVKTEAQSGMVGSGILRMSVFQKLFDSVRADDPAGSPRKDRIKE